MKTISTIYMHTIQLKYLCKIFHLYLETTTDFVIDISRKQALNYFPPYMSEEVIVCVNQFSSKKSLRFSDVSLVINKLDAGRYLIRFPRSCIFVILPPHSIRSCKKYNTVFYVYIV